MNQILVTDKVFITPEFKRKKKIYKWNFILSVAIVSVLSMYCVYAYYDMNKSEEVSQMLLADMELAEAMFEQPEQNEINSNMMRKEDNVIIVVLDPYEQARAQAEEISVDDVVSADDYVINTETYYASDGTPYTTIGRITIPKINVDYPILSQTNIHTVVELLKKSPCKFWGTDPNEVGNFCIVGHNYRNSKFFSKVPSLQIGDTIEITDLKKRKVTYMVYDKYEVVPEDVSCTDQRTNGRKEVTLITCTNDSSRRVIVKCVEQNNQI